MTIPSAPTTTTICTEALRRFLNSGDPTADEITRAMNYGFEKVKRDIMGIGKTWRPLLRVEFDITASGVSHYDNPADFGVDFSAGLMIGTHTGILQAVGSSTQVTLDASEDATEAEVEGKYLLLTSGTGVNQAVIISGYNITSKVCALSEALTTLPNTSTGYMIVGETKDLILMGLARYDQYNHPGITGQPIRYIPVPNQTVGQVALHPTPDGVYGIRRRYYADLLKMDMGSDLYSTILRKWANLFEQGVYVWKLQEDDNRYEGQNAIYQQMLSNILVTDLDGYQAPAKSE